MKKMYCAECEEMVVVEEPVEGHSRIIWDGDPKMQWDVMWCEGPFFDSEPPADDPDWDLQDEPTGDELFIMNKNAEELLQDLGVA